MRAKQLIILLIILGVLSVFAFMAHQSNKPAERPPADSDQAKLFPSLNTDEIASIKIKSLGAETAIARDDTGTWVVPDQDNYPADAQAIQRMLDALDKLDRGSVVSRNPEKQAIYEVDDKLGTEVTILDKNDNELAHFFVGKAVQDFFSTNIRVAGQDEVRLVRQMMSHMFKRPGGDWREKLIFDVDEAKITRYAVTGEEGSALFEKSEQGTWSTIEPADAKEVTPDDIERAPSGLAKLRASGFGEEKDQDKFELDKPKWTITVTTDDGEAYTLKVCGEKSKAQYFVQREGKDTVFYISKYQVDRMTKPLKQALGIEEKKPDKSPKMPAMPPRKPPK
ncbi:MAG: DUF4340 domain-containing protein [Candidatus Coatesbacteria bacterium]|nr:DUF4340 domain-containing protein [Candidatus Coatesbacteria bacterium]